MTILPSTRRQRGRTQDATRTAPDWVLAEAISAMPDHQPDVTDDPARLCLETGSWPSESAE